MCVIIIFNPGQMIGDDELRNACFNNWHSWGMTTQSVNEKGLQPDLKITRSVPDKSGIEDGEISFDEVKTALVENTDKHRVLHLRHTTAGVTDLDNCHPFDVYSSGKQRVVFMHNGTMSAYTPKKKVGEHNYITDLDGPSDTSRFVDIILKPTFKDLIKQADYTTHITKKLLAGVWPMQNRGILVSKLHPPLTFGEWKELKATDGSALTVSNLLYFDSVTRGPEHDRREAVKRSANSTGKSRKASGRAPASIILDPINDAFDLSLIGITLSEEYDCFSQECVKALATLSYDEWDQLLADAAKKGHLLSNKDLAVVDIIYYLIGEYAKSIEDQDALVKQCAGLRATIDNLKNKGKAA